MSPTASVDALFVERAECRPDAVAVVDGGKKLTYGQLVRLRADIAVILRDAGVRSGEPVGLLLPRGWRMIAATLGVWAHGCAYVPIDPDLPAARRRAIVAEAGLCRVLEFEHGNFLIRDLGHRPREIVDLPDGTAYVMFTSGSTGRPKGVVVGHDNLLSLFDACATVFDFNEDDVWSQFHSHAFDFSVWETWGPLLGGGRCVIVPLEATADAGALVGFLAESRVSVLNLVPSVFRRFLDVLPEQDLPHLRTVILGGEAVTNDMVRYWFDEGYDDGRKLCNMYGITEITVHATVKRLHPADGGNAHPLVPIGKPLPGTRIELVEDGVPVPPGMAGEIHVAGGGVAAGYLGRPDLTARQFITTDFGDGVRRWYRSGDYATRRSDGDLVYVGRRDEQVKINGVRIETGEIEHWLTRHPGIEQAIVVAVGGTSDAPAELIAVLVAATAVQPQAAELRAWVGERLPRALVPRAFHWVERVPRGANGKVDRKGVAVLARRWWRPAGGGEVKPADGDLDALWHGLFPDDPKAARTAGFLNLGGSSLVAGQLIARIRKTFEVAVPPSVLLRDNAGLSTLREMVRTAPRSSPPATSSGTGRRNFPLSPEQRRMWLIDRILPGAAGYNVVGALKFEGRMDVEGVRRALAAVVRRHDLLRAVLDEADLEAPRWRYPDSGTEPELLVESAEELDNDTVAAFARRIAARQLRLEEPPHFLAGMLCAAGSEQSCLVLSLHHIVSDQVTLNLVFTDFAAQYAGRPLGEAPSFAEYAERACAETGSDEFERDLAYWRARLKGAPREVGLPFRARRSSPASTAGSTRSLALEGLTREIDDLLRRAAVTPAMLVVTVVALVLSAWSAQSTIVVGMPSVRRRTMEERGMVGFLTSTLPVRIDIESEKTVSALLEHVRTRCAEALDHDTPSFDKIVDQVGGRTLPGRNPLFTVWVNDVSAPVPAPEIPGVLCRPVVLPTTAALFELNFYLHRDPAGYRLELVNATDVVSDTVAEEILAQCELVLEQVIADPCVEVAQLSLRTEAARRSVACVPDVATAERVVCSFGQVVRGQPAAPAIVSGGHTVTYGALARSINLLCAQLTAAGVAEGDLVEVRARRDEHLPAVLLAVWSVRGVAVLIDDALPPRRVEAQSRSAAARWALMPSDDGTPPALVDRGGAPPRRYESASHILFTSGTTGTPAAVVVGETAFTAALQAYLGHFDFGPGDRVPLVAGSGHDPVLRDVLAPLLSGGVLVVPREADSASPDRLLRLLIGEAVTVLHVTPGLLELLTEAAEESRSPLTALRLVVSGGGPLASNLVRRTRRISAATVVNGYGATETPQLATWLVADDDLLVGDTVPVGAGTGTAALAVVDAAGKPVGVGQRGEVVVRSRHLAMGYLGESEREGAFGPDPAGNSEVRSYRTGDLGRVDGQGHVHLDGRSDRQVQVNGFRVELQEIEAAAVRCRGVRQAAAGLVTGTLGEMLVLDVVPEAGAHVTPSGLRAQLGTYLPRALVPPRVRLVPSLSLNANHKPVVDDQGNPSASRGARPPSRLPAGNSLATILRMLEDLLRRPVRPEENFFDAGLDSIALLRLCGRIRSGFATPIVIAEVFANPNAAALASHLDGLGATAPRRNHAGGAGVSGMRETRRAVRARLRDAG